jgi:hypothetical protein
LDDAGELMTQDAAELRITAEHLQIGSADAGARNPNQAVVAGGRNGHVTQCE